MFRPSSFKLISITSTTAEDVFSHITCKHTRRLRCLEYRSETSSGIGHTWPLQKLKITASIFDKRILVLLILGNCSFTEKILLSVIFSGFENLYCNDPSSYLCGVGRNGASVLIRVFLTL